MSWLQSTRESAAGGTALYSLQILTPASGQKETREELRADCLIGMPKHTQEHILHDLRRAYSTPLPF